MKSYYFSLLLTGSLLGEAYSGWSFPNVLPTWYELKMMVMGRGIPNFEAVPSSLPPALTRLPIRFDRNEVAGAFGDLGTDLPLLIGVIAA